MRRALIVPMLLLVAAAPSSPGVEPPTWPASQAKDGVRFEVQAFGAGVQFGRLADGRIEARREVTVACSFSAPAGGLIAGPIEFVSLADEKGESLLAGAALGSGAPMTRRDLINSVSMPDWEGERRAYASASVWNLARVSRVVGALKARAGVYTIGGCVLARVPANVMAEPEEVGPGATFLVSRVRERGGQVIVSFEAALARDPARESPADAPVVEAVHAVDAAGQRLLTLDHPPEVTTRARYIVAVEDWGIASETWARVDHFEVSIASDVRFVEFEFEFGPIPIWE